MVKYRVRRRRIIDGRRVVDSRRYHSTASPAHQALAQFEEASPKPVGVKEACAAVTAVTLAPAAPAHIALAYLFMAQPTSVRPAERLPSDAQASQNFLPAAVRDGWGRLNVLVSDCEGSPAVHPKIRCVLGCFRAQRSRPSLAIAGCRRSRRPEWPV